MRDEIIERMARTGYECSEWDHKQPWDKNPWAQEAWRKCARAMIEAMQEPTEAMISAARRRNADGSLVTYGDDRKARECWRVMIETALS